VLEIIEKDARPGSRGDEYLYFRLYRDGKVEFETSVLDASTPHDLRVQRIRIDASELDDLASLGWAGLALPDDFDPMQGLEEKVAIITITIMDEQGEYQHKVIHRYSPENEMTHRILPEAARNLMNQVRSLRLKYFQEA